jgi:hypothetical protein
MPPRRADQAGPVRTRDGGAATADVRHVVEQAAKVQTFVGAHQVPTAIADWHTVQTSLGKIQQAFGLVE